MSTSRMIAAITGAASRTTSRRSTPCASPDMETKERSLTKSELLDWLREEYRQWELFLDQIGPMRMTQAGVNGVWSMKDIVAHLTGWNRNLAAQLQAAQRGEPEPPPPWPAQIVDQDEINAWIYKTYRERSLREV